ncbi:unannotated protein [freshwater metagenome]|uniref:Unannotated protein n=1 Tax=freshwater metagenome TaxID=449393 RepID=A0A6J6ZAR2_9ZZZZ
MVSDDQDGARAESYSDQTRWATPTAITDVATSATTALLDLQSAITVAAAASENAAAAIPP